ncbi:MAG: type II secretion system F family protein [Nitrososphaerota archaeon]|nr:type II secretion system F family protein [Nitrososphaerota archaeon]
MSKDSFQRLGASSEPAAANFTSLEKYTSLSYRIFRRPAGTIASHFPNLHDDIAKSDLNITPQGLISVALLTTVITVGAVLGLVFAIFPLFPPIALLLLAPIFPFMITLSAPRFSQANRSSRLDSELPFLMGYLSILSGGGISLMTTLRRVARLAKWLPASAKEAGRMILEVDLYGNDPITALDKSAKFNPHNWFSDMLTGYATILRTGGDHISYLNDKLKEALGKRETKYKRASETTSLLSETYLIIVVVLGITIFTIFIVQTFIGSVTTGISNIVLFAFIIVPIVTAGFVWMLDGVQPKLPFTDMRPYKLSAFSLPIGLVLFFVPLPFPLYLRMSISLIVASVPPAVLAIKYQRQRLGIEKMLPGFMRDVTEGRRIGLPPEGSIERLHGRKYGALSKPVWKMSSQLSWGVSLSRVLGSFTSAVNSWIAKAMGILMLEVVEIGGGTLKGFSEMEDFTRKVNTLETESRSSSRAYTFIAYIAAVLIIVTTFVFIYFLSAPAASHLPGGGSVTQIGTGTIDLLLTSSVFEAWVIGFMAGKLGENSTAQGFKHASIMVAIALVTIFVGQMMLPLSI